MSDGRTDAERTSREIDAWEAAQARPRDLHAEVADLGARMERAERNITILVETMEGARDVLAAHVALGRPKR